MAHMHYKGTGKIHSFKGLLADEEQRKIRIQGPVGAVAWRISKFEIMPNTPGAVNAELIIQIWREEQSDPTAVSTINFDHNELLAAGFSRSSTAASESGYQFVTFDNALFTRNIWVTLNEINGSASGNYYIELEEVKLSQAGMAQLAVAAARRTID